MKWFKHDSKANQDAKLKRVRMKYGMEGYGLYWYCIEMVAVNVEQNRLTFDLEHDAEIIAFDTGIHYERVQEMMTFMVNLGLFEDSSGVITCLKLAKRADEYTAKYLKTQLKNIKSGECRENVGIKSSPKEIKRDKIKRDNNNKPPASAKPKYEDCDLDFAKCAFEEILKHSPDHKKPNLNTWASDVRKMRMIDNRSLDEMASVWIWVRNDSFWFKNVLSISKFREKYDQLKLAMQERKHENNQRPDNSAAGRVRANAQRELAEIEARQQQGYDNQAMAIDG